MKRFVLFTVMLHFLLCLSAQQEVYFNKRIDLSDGYDKGLSLLEVNNKYVIGTITDDSTYHYFWQLAFVTIDSAGNKLNTKVYGDTISHHMLGNPGALIDYENNKYYAVGNIISPGGDWVFNRGWMLCLDNNFDTLWTRTYGETTEPYDTTFVIFQIKKTFNRNLITTGVRLPKLTPSSLWLMETDSMGNKLWETFIGGEDEYYYQGHSVVQTDDGGYAIGAVKFKIESTGGSMDPLIIKTDSLGNEEWRFNPGNPDIDDNKVMLALSENGNIIIGTNYGTKQSQDNRWAVNKIMEISPIGQIKWDSNYCQPDFDRILLSININNNGNIITNGVMTVFENGDAWNRSWILCVDSIGEQLWYKEYALLLNKNSFNNLMDVKQTADNGLIGCGVVIPVTPDTGTVDIWVMKMDSVGCLEAGCDTIVGLDEINKNPMRGFRIFPNPASSELTLALDEESSSNSDVKIVNIYGIKTNKITIPAGSKSVNIDISSWKPGVYFATFNSSKNVTSVKFIIKR